MKELYYVIQTLIHGRGANLIKVISLTLGLTVSILIFAREAFEFNYDTCYEDSECLAAVPLSAFRTGLGYGGPARHLSRRKHDGHFRRLDAGECGGGGP